MSGINRIQDVVIKYLYDYVTIKGNQYISLCNPVRSIKMV